MRRSRSGCCCSAGACLLLVLLVCSSGLPGCRAFPELFASRHADSSCVAHPGSLHRYGRHGRVSADRSTVIRISQNRIPVGALCPGGEYDVSITFAGGPRLALLTTTIGNLQHATNASCLSQEFVAKRGHQAVTNHSTVLTVACGPVAAARVLELRVTSAASSTASLQSTALRLAVDLAASDRCVDVSEACAPVRPAAIIDADAAASNLVAATFIPLTPSAMNGRSGPSSSGLQGDGGSAQGGSALPEYAFEPILHGNRTLWQVLHSLLMLLAFCVLMPLGTLLARHKWLFGRNSLTSKVMSSWGPVHVLCQVLGLLSAAAGVVIAILAFGWKAEPSQRLYLPHKWTGVGVMGMALVQLVLGMARPENGGRARGCWNSLHHTWGRALVLAGMGNCVLGSLLIHSMKGDPYLYWLLPACVLVGVAGLTALILEAFKLQMQRTYRYNPKTRTMLPVGQGFKHSKRRSGGAPGRTVARNNGYAGAASPEPDRPVLQFHPGGDGSAAVAALPAAYPAAPGALPAVDSSGRPVVYPVISHRAPTSPPKAGFEPPRV